MIFTFDGDAAGQKAALRAFSLEEKFVTQTFVAVQPDGLDPCDLRLKHGEGAVRDLVARRVPLFEFAISGARQARPGHTEGQLAALDEAAPIVARIKDPGMRGRYAVNLDRWLGLMDERFVLQRVRQHAAGTRGGQRHHRHVLQTRRQGGRRGRPAARGRGGRARAARGAALRPVGPRAAGGAGGAQAGGAGPGAVRARVRRARRWRRSPCACTARWPG